MQTTKYTSPLIVVLLPLVLILAAIASLGFLVSLLRKPVQITNVTIAEIMPLKVNKIFVNVKTGERRECTSNELKLEFNLHASSLSKLCKGNLRSLKGWTIES